MARDAVVHTWALDETPGISSQDNGFRLRYTVLGAVTRIRNWGHIPNISAFGRSK